MSQKINKKRTCGRVAIIGPTNAGKSTLLNAFLGKKLSIVSHKVQTTRKQINAILTNGLAQIIFIDTPGLFKPTNYRERPLIREAMNSLQEADVLIYMIDPTKINETNYFSIYSQIKNYNGKIMVVINKIDLVKKTQLLNVVKEIKEQMNEEDIHFISALKLEGVGDFLNNLIKIIPQKDWEYPEKLTTNISEKFIAEEFTREKILHYIHKEIPYSIKIDTEKWSEKNTNEIEIYQNIYVDSDNHKKIILGKNGEKIKRISTESRIEIQNYLNKKVHLYLFIKQKKNNISNSRNYI